MDGITVITTEAITIGITIAATITGTEDGLSPLTGALGIIAIGKQYYPVFAIGYRLAGIFVHTCKLQLVEGATLVSD
jgi:hypothetical protein